MVEIFINLTPAFSGVVSEIGTFEWGDWQPFINLPPSLEGVISASVTLSGLPPGLMIQVRIPAQNIGGVAYKEVYTTSFPWDQTAFSDSIILEQVTPPNGPNGNGFPLKEIAIPTAIGLALLLLL